MRVLLVDDDDSIRESLGLILEDLGCTVVPAASGEEAMEKLDGPSPDLLLLDLYLPGNLHGLEVCTRVRSRPGLERVPVALLSVEMPAELMAQGRRAGATDFLCKDAFMVESIKKLVSKYHRSVPALTRAGLPSGLAFRIQQKLKESMPFRPLPSVAQELMQVATGSSADLNAIVNVIKKDVALMARVLKLSNSAMYRKKDPVYTLDRAVINIGLAGIRDAGMGMSMVEQMLNSRVEGGLDRLQLCRHAVATGAVAYTLARMAQYKNPEEMLLCGLIHDIGMTFFDEVVPQAYATLLARLSEDGSSLTALEREALGGDHAMIGEQILSRWGVHESIRASAAHHHDDYLKIVSSASPWKLQMLMVKVADQLAQAILASPLEDDALEEIPSAVTETLGIYGKQYQEISRQVDRDMEELNTILLLHGQASAVQAGDASGETKAAVFIDESESTLNPVYMLLHGLKYTVFEGEGALGMDHGILPRLVLVMAQTEDFAGRMLDRAASLNAARVLLYSGTASDPIRSRCQSDSVTVLTPPYRLSKLRQVIP